MCVWEAHISLSLLLSFSSALVLLSLLPSHSRSSRREIDFPLILPRPRTRPHGPISPGDAMNKKFTESRARRGAAWWCSSTVGAATGMQHNAERPTSIYGAPYIGKEERGTERKGERKRVNRLFCRDRSDVERCSTPSPDQFYITGRLKRTALRFSPFPINRVSGVEAVRERNGSNGAKLSEGSPK